MKPSLVDKARRILRDAFTSHVRLKALALVITAFIFILVRGGREATARITVEVQATPPGASDDRVLMTEVPESVKLRVRGSPRVVQLATEEEIPRLELDLRNESDGTFVLDPSLFRLPPGLEVVNVTPPTFGLMYERRIKREVAVHPIISGQAIKGHHVKDPIITEPSKVNLSGPESVVRRQQEVETELIPVEGLGVGYHKRLVRLETPPPNCFYEGVSKVNVVLIVEPDLIERTFQDLDVQVNGSTLPSSAERVSVVVRGIPSAIEAIRPQDLRVSVELGDDGAVPGSYRREVQLSGLDPSLQARAVPSSVIVEVQRAPPQPQEAASP